MTTDFTYGNKAFNISGPIKPSGKNQPLDLRTEVKLYADIENIPTPYIGMIITVLEDETNSNKMTDYKVLSLKANASGIANSVVDQVQRYVDYLGAGSVSQDDINTAVNNYLTENPVAGGATAEQAAQIEANKTAIGDENSGLIKEINDVKNNELENLNTAVQTLETLVGLDETIGDKSGLPSGDENVIASINRINNKQSGNITDEQVSTAVNNYLTEHPVTSGATEEQATQIEANKNALGGLSFKKVNTKEEYDNLPESDIGNPNLVLIKSYEEPITKDSFSLTVGEKGEYQFRVNGDVKFSFSAGSGGVIENVYGNILLDNNTITIDEESSFSLNISLDKAPTNPQTVYVSTSNELLTKSVSSLTFNSSNYSNTQSITFTAIADDDVTNNECEITFSSEGVPSIVCTVSITDNDTPTGEIAITGINIVEDSITLTQWEGTDTPFTVAFTPSNTTQKEYTTTIDGTTNKIMNFMSGKLYGRVPGSSTLTVTSKSDTSLKDTCNVTVVENTKTKTYGEELFDLNTVVTELAGNVDSAYFTLDKDIDNNRLKLTFNKGDFAKTIVSCCASFKIDDSKHFFKYGHLYKIECDFDFNFDDSSAMKPYNNSNIINMAMNVNAGTQTSGSYYINSATAASLSYNGTPETETAHIKYEGMCLPDYTKSAVEEGDVLLILWFKYARTDQTVPVTFTSYISNISVKEFTLS